ncbi:MAG: hypothetical protein MJ193_04700, partial [Clostridia bacterium]|nr:hypothetical protein [Clostridia bacterium]
GGSLEDLAPFYDEELVRTVYAMNTPVVSAVGHETDFSLCDFVADARAATPTAAAELVAYDYYEFVRTLKEYSSRLSLLAKNQYERKMMRTKLAVQKLGHQAQTFYQERATKVLSLANQLKILTTDKIVNAEHKVDKAITALDALSPLKTLKRGYFAVEKDGKRMTTVKNFKVGDEFVAVGGDGKIVAEVTDVIPAKEI